MRMFILGLLVVMVSTHALADISGGGLMDYYGNGVTSNLFGGTRNALDVETVISGTVVDPRARTWTLLNTTDSVNAVQSGTWTVQQGSAPWSVSQSGTWTTGRTWTLSSGSDSVTSVQGTSPWVTNISQFGGTNISTGTGASGAGIARVTVSNDSNILATQSGTWTVQQGATPTSSANAWPVKPTDGTNVITIKPASTASVTTDTAQVVALSPNSPLPTGSNNVGSITNITGTVSLPTLAATSTKQSDGTQKTQVVDAANATVGPVTTISGVNYAPVTRPAGSTSGTLTAACATGVSCAAGSTLNFTVPEGQSSWDIYLNGTFSAASEVAFEGSIDNTNWFFLNGRRNTDINTNDTTTTLDVSPMGGTPPTGSNPSNWRGSIGAIKFMRVRCVIYTAADSIGVQISTSTAVGAVFLNAAPPSVADKNMSGTITAACSTPASCPANSSISAASSGMSSLWLSVTGTWVANLLVEGQAGDSNWTTVICSVPGQDNTAVSLTTNAILQCAIGGANQVRVRASTYTSGTVSVQYNLGAGVSNVHVTNLNATALLATVSGTVSTKTPLTPNAPFTVSVGVSSGVFLAANTSRKGLCIVNTSNATESFGLAATAVLNSGITLYPGGTWCMDEFSYMTGAINAIAGTASSGAAGQEFQ